MTAQLTRVDRELRRLEELPAALRAKLDNPVLLKQMAPWLDRVGVTGQAGRAALRVLRAQDAGRQRSRPGWRDGTSRAPCSPRPHLAPDQPRSGDEGLSFAASQSDAYIGDRWYGDLGAPTGAPAAASGSRLGNLTDRRDDTLYVAAGAPQAGDAITVPITKPHKLSAVTVVQDAAAPADGMIQALVDGTWVDLGQLADGFTKVQAKDLAASAVRIQWTPGSVAPRVYEIVPHYSDVLRGRVSVEPSGASSHPGDQTVPGGLEVFDEGRVRQVSPPAARTAGPSPRRRRFSRRDRMVGPSSRACRLPSPSRPALPRAGTR